MTAAPDPMRDIEPMERPAGAGWRWPVHRTGRPEDPPVIVMHELHGLSPACTEFCRTLASTGLGVWMPQLVGRAPSVSRGDRARAAGAVCVSREIDVLRSGRTSPVVRPLRALARHLSGEHGGGRVGVVGMCLSGGFALAMAAEPAVVASVAAQPTLPLRPVLGRTLGLSDEDADAVRRRLAGGDVEVYYTRFEKDPLSPRGRCARVADRLGPTGVHVDVLPAAGFRRLEHSVLTGAPAHYGGAGPQSARLAQSAQQVADFLHRRLGDPTQE